MDRRDAVPAEPLDVGFNLRSFALGVESPLHLRLGGGKLANERENERGGERMREGERE
jgi:hypothetical protein